MMNPLPRIIKAFGYTFSGLKHAAMHETAFTQELVLAVIFIPLALYLKVSITAKILMVCSILFILIAELINSAIEAVVDRISSEKHPLSKQAKDMGSAIVFLAFVQAAIIWFGFLLFK